MFCHEPVCVPLTENAWMQPPPAASEAPERLTLLGAVTVKVPPQKEIEKLAGAVIPAGKVSWKPIPLNVVELFVLIISMLMLMKAPIAVLVLAGAVAPPVEEASPLVGFV